MRGSIKTVLLLAGALVGGGLLLTLGETWRWWGLWKRSQNVPRNRHAASPDSEPSAIKMDHTDAPVCIKPRKAIAWISGVSDYGDSALRREQIAFVRRLASHCSSSIALQESVPANPAVDKRYRRRDVWRMAGLHHPPLWTWALHNFWQFAFASVCERAYGRDVANVLHERLQARGVEAGSPIMLVCGSAGAQIALAAAPFLRAKGYDPLYGVMLGGEFGSPQGLDAMARCAQLAGKQDRWARAGTWLFWVCRLPGSAYSRALREGRLLMHSSGPHTHFGARSYLDTSSFALDGRTYADITFDSVLELPWWDEWTKL